MRARGGSRPALILIVAALFGVGGPPARPATSAWPSVLSGLGARSPPRP